MRKSVVLPQLFGQSRAKISPAAISSETSTTAGKPPNFFATPSMRSSGMSARGSRSASMFSASSAIVPPAPPDAKLAADGRGLNRWLCGKVRELRRRCLVHPLHERRQRLAIPGRHGQAQLGTPPQNIVGKARPLFLHEVAQLGSRQFGTESPPEIFPTFGLSQDIADAPAIGADEPLRLRFSEEWPPLARGDDLPVESLPGEIATRQRRH